MDNQKIIKMFGVFLVIVSGMAFQVNTIYSFIAGFILLFFGWIFIENTEK